MTDIVLSNSSGDIGILSSQGSGRVEFISISPVEGGTLAYQIDSLTVSSNLLGVDPDQALDTIVASAQKADETLVASTTQTPKPYSELSPWSITTDDEDNRVLGLVFIDESGQVFVREAGGWVSPQPDDERFYENTFYFVSEEAVNLFDKLVQDGNTPVFDDFDGVTLV